jgi:hypothetical protein
MSRKITVLGMAIAAVLAMSAFGATAAQATPQFTCSAYPCTATGSASLGAEKFVVDGAAVECASHYLIEKEGGGDLTAGASAVTVTPTYTGCKAFTFLNATVNMGGCDYVFHATEKVSAGVYKHHVDLVCSTGGHVLIEGGGCVVDVGAQTGLTTVKTTNEGNNVKVEPEVSGVVVNKTADPFGCPLSGTGAGTGTFTGSTTVHNVAGGTSTVSLSGE